MKKYKFILGLLVSVIFIIVILRNINYSHVWSAIIGIKYYLLIPAIIIQLSSYWVRSIRWSLILNNIKKIRTSNLFPTICISYMLNNVLPLRIGEFARAYHVSQKEGISASSAFSTIVLERIYDGLTLLMFLGVISFLYPFPEWVKKTGLLTGAVFIIAFLFCVFIVFAKNKTLKFFSFVLKIFPLNVRDKFIKIIDQFISGFDIVKDKRVLFPILIYSILTWLMEGYMFYALAAAFNFKDSIFVGIFALVIINFGIMLPSSPGYIGTFEYFCTKGLEVFGVSREVALSYALILRFIQYLPITLVGFVFLLKEGVSVSQILQFKERGKLE